jgi:hypothetical protein
MTDQQKEALLAVLEGLMRRYRERVPDVEHIITEMVNKGVIDKQEDIINDHIAFRTLGVGQLGIQSLEKVFLAYGYTKRDRFYFPQKQVDANWFSPPEDIPNLPRVFISECRVSAFTQETQDIIRKYSKHITSDPVDGLDLMNGKAVDEFLHTQLWTQPTWEDYSTVSKESEYVSWILNNRYYLNHFTVSIHELNDGHDNIETYNNFLESIGIKLNDAGGKIKRSADGKLLQSSSVSNQINVEFNCEDGAKKEHLVPGSYVEFAQRIDGRDGFDQDSANKIFESTYSDQVNK